MKNFMFVKLGIVATIFCVATTAFSSLNIEIKVNKQEQDTQDIKIVVPENNRLHML